MIRQTFKTLGSYDLLETDVSVEDKDFSTSMTFLGEGRVPLLVVKLPSPRNTAEAGHIGIVLGRPVRYFTLELHVPDEIERQINPGAQTKYVLAEWVNKEHKLMGGGWSEPDLAGFCSAIERFVSTVV